MRIFDWINKKQNKKEIASENQALNNNLGKEIIVLEKEELIKTLTGMNHI